VPVNNSPVFDPYTVFFHRLCRNGEAVDQFVDCKDNRFEVTGFRAAG
jgi:hypothetical protein